MVQWSSQDSLEAGRLAHRAGRLGDAEALYRQVLEVEPGNAGAMHLLGVLEIQAGHHHSAVDLIGRAIAVKPSAAEYHCNLGLALAGTGKLDEAVVALLRALELRPDYGEALSNLGLVLGKKGQVGESISAYRQALELRPGSVEIRVNLGSALAAGGQMREAIEEFGRALAIDPGHAMAHWNLGLTLLRVGDYEKGWVEYEWRERVNEPRTTAREFGVPRWEGEALNGGRILLHTEQGLGDAIQFARYVPLVAGMGFEVVLECQAELVGLMRGMGVGQVVTRGEALRRSSGLAQPGFDWHCPLLSLPLVMGTTVQTIPDNVPYLRADAEKVEHWRRRIGDDGRVRVGLVWAGRKRPNPHRTIGLAGLSALAEVEGARFFSLQKGHAAREAQTVPAGIALEDWTAELGDFAETAALVANLDLVVTIDTAVAHLAGAMGKAVWVLLPFDPDWRWMMGREDSPWYPTMRLFRQAKFADWAGAVGRVVEELKRIKRD